MEIDDPISALQSLHASDERQRSPVSHLAKEFLAIVKLFSPPGADIPLAGLDFAMGWLNSRTQKNREELLDAAVEEIKYHGAQVERLLATSEEHRRFMADEMPGLVLDALRRGEQTRSRERIRRLGRILVHAAEVGPKDGADHAEEIMRIASVLADIEVAALGHIASGQSGLLGSKGRVSDRDAQMGWVRLLPFPGELRGGALLSVCVRLEAEGLITRTERPGANQYAAGEAPFALLKKGKDFIEYVARAAE